MRRDYYFSTSHLKKNNSKGKTRGAWAPVKKICSLRGGGAIPIKASQNDKNLNTWKRGTHNRKKSKKALYEEKKLYNLDKENFAIFYNLWKVLRGGGGGETGV